MLCHKLWIFSQLFLLGAALPGPRSHIHPASGAVVRERRDCTHGHHSTTTTHIHAQDVTSGLKSPQREVMPEEPTPTTPLRDTTTTSASEVTSELKPDETNEATAASSATAAPGNSTGYRNGVYYGNWDVYQRKYAPSKIDGSQLTHLIYGFVDVKQDGTVFSVDTRADLAADDEQKPGGGAAGADQDAHGNIAEVYELKRKNPHLKTILSIGGWNWSEHINKMILDKDARQKLATSAVALMTDWGFDGLDIDWEYPTNKAEAQGYVELLKASREEMDGYSKKHDTAKFTLSVACSAGPQHYQMMDLAGMDKHLDIWHLMAYDYSGKWDKTSGHSANIRPDAKNGEATKFNTQQAVKYYLDQGVSAGKISLGLPLYGRSFEATGGLGQGFEGVGKGSWEEGLWDYRGLPKPGAEEHYDEQLVAAWSYDPSTRELVSYDNAASTRAKAAYIKEMGLGGAFFWDASSDKDGDDSLVTVMRHSLGTLESSPNNMKYDTSRYQNIRNQQKPGS